MSVVCEEVQVLPKYAMHCFKSRTEQTAVRVQVNIQYGVG